MKNGYNWIASEVQFLRENYLTMSDAEIARVICRSPAGVERKRFLLKLFKPAVPRVNLSKERAAIKARWLTMPPGQIAAEIGIKETLVRELAGKMALGSSPVRAQTPPRERTEWSRPRGMIADQIQWAKANPEHPEARLIMALASEKRVNA